MKWLKLFPYQIFQKKVNKAAEKLAVWQSKKPVLYHKSKTEWEKLAKREDVDLVIIATPWDLHTPMAIYCMQSGKHVGSEVPVASTVEDCWKIIETAERNQKHCMMMENCNYNEEELWVLNMIQEGVFGDYEGSLIIKRSLIPLLPCMPPVCMARIVLPLGK